MAASYPLLEQATLERRLADGQASYGLSDSDWDQLVADVIEEESAFVAGELADEGIALAEFGDTASLLSEYPVVRRAMVRLCRASIHNIASDGLSSESVGDHSEDYRPPSELRAEVRGELSGVDGSSDTDDGESEVRASVI